MPEQALLLLADIGGYTEFMRLHRLNLAHSQEITQRLLESMLGAVPAMRLVEVEGDALFLAAPRGEQRHPAGSSGWLQWALAMYRAFHVEQQWMVAHNLCVCDACRRIERLHVKFAAHLGEVVTQRIRDTEKLVGVDVIAVHRMLKNTVPVAEPLYRELDPELRDRAVLVEEELEGLGRMPLRFVDLNDVPVELPAVPPPSLAARIRETVGFGLRALPRAIRTEELESSSGT
jgi:uncharacterized protein DUF2652